MFLGGELYFLDTDASNDFEREDWLLLASTFLYGWMLFYVSLMVQLPYSQVVIMVLYGIFSQKVFPPAFTKIYKDISGYLLFSYSLA